MKDNDSEEGKQTNHLLPFQKRKQLERDIDSVTAEMMQRNQELAETNKTLSLLRTIDAMVLESHASLKMVCAHITEAITQSSDYALVALLTKSSHTRDELTLNGWSGSQWLGKDAPLGFGRPVHVQLTHEWFAQPLSTLIVSLDDMSDEALSSYINVQPSDIQRLRHDAQLKSLYIVKLLARRKLVGLLVVGFQSSASDITDKDTAIVDRVCESIGVALDNKLLFEENQFVLKQLRDSNERLRELDEAKDDFISMASHQLRTPLTSIKGYISMMIDGDAGKITPTQKQLLEQAYFSSQRMVYLIADLLNVSRLKTHKFLIDAKQVDIAKVVQEEVAQLESIAKSHNLKLDYQKPDTKTGKIELMLDETKTRQIIMNFIDNAIYYSPPGGQISVKLIDKPSTVELRVEDEGMGVPKSEQPHLFTKFYRAANARKARPDGTGLGLFMAKKVIVAQHGSVIFESHENKGSTFGFIFSKHKLAVTKDVKISDL